MSKLEGMLKVVILGDGGVGKSSIMARFVNNMFESNSYHTIGVEFLNKEIVVDGRSYHLQIWDTAGQERFRSLVCLWYDVLSSFSLWSAAYTLLSRNRRMYARIRRH